MNPAPPVTRVRTALNDTPASYGCGRVGLSGRRWPLPEPLPFSVRMLDGAQRRTGSLHAMNTPHVSNSSATSKRAVIAFAPPSVTEDDIAAVSAVLRSG